MRLALVEVYEVASFYAHFDIVMEDEDAAAGPDGPGLRQPHLRDAGRAHCSSICQAKLGSDVRVVRAPCMGGCHNAPVVAIGHALHEHATVDERGQGGEAGHGHAQAPAAYPTSTLIGPTADTSCSKPV